MLLKIWRFITLILIALFMGSEFCHVLELPAKMQYDEALYVMIQNTLYGYFGLTVPGAFITLGAFISTVILTFLICKRRLAFYWTLAGTICLLLAFPVIFFLFIEPVSIVIEQATPESAPADWMRLRNQWEYSHAANFILSLAGLVHCFFLYSLRLRQTVLTTAQTNSDLWTRMLCVPFNSDEANKGNVLNLPRKPYESPQYFARKYSETFHVFSASS